jgi:hypothetical protein
MKTFNDDRCGYVSASVVLRTALHVSFSFYMFVRYTRIVKSIRQVPADIKNSTPNTPSTNQTAQPR